MFKIVENRTFKHTVKVMMPSDGGYDSEEFEATLKYLQTEEVGKFDLNAVDGTTNFLKHIVVRLDGLTDENGQPLPYSDKLRDLVISMPNAREAILKAFFNAVGKACEGN